MIIDIFSTTHQQLEFILCLYANGFAGKQGKQMESMCSNYQKKTSGPGGN